MDFIYQENFVDRSLNLCKSFDIMKELKSTIRKILFNYKDISDSMDVSDIKDIDDGLKKVILENSFEVNFRLLEKIRLDNA